jgi:hypothetical protein
MKPHCIDPPLFCTKADKVQAIIVSPHEFEGVNGTGVEICKDGQR